MTDEARPSLSPIDPSNPRAQVTLFRDGKLVGMYENETAAQGARVEIEAKERGVHPRSRSQWRIDPIPSP